MNLNLKEKLTDACGKDLILCTDEELYTGLLCLTQSMAAGKESKEGKKEAVLYFRRIPDWKASLQQFNQFRHL